MWLAAFGVVCHARTASAQTPQEFKAVGADQVTAAIAAFKAAIGGSDNGSATGSQGSGYRQITWDDVPDASATPVFLPKDYYDTISLRGFLFSDSSAYRMWEVSAVEPNANGTPALFGNRNAVFPSLYTTYSPGRIMRSAGTDNPFYIDLKIPGSSEVASVSGFGAVFIDVDRENLSSLEFYDAENRSLGTFFVPPASGTKTVSFLGVIFPPGAGRISRVRIQPGYVHVQQPQDEEGGRDLVALDDFIYAEPQRVGAPTITITSPTASLTLGAHGPFVDLGAVSTNTVTMEWVDTRGRKGSFFRAYGETEWRALGIPLEPGINAFIVTATSPNGDTATDVVNVTSFHFEYHLAEGSTGTFFDTDILIANPNAVPAHVQLTFLREDGERVLYGETLPPMSRKTIHADDVSGLEDTAFSTTVVSPDRLPLVVERAMFWDTARYDGNGAAAVDQTSHTWFFAEGVQNDFFDTFVLLQNPNWEPANATLTFTRDFGEPPVVHSVGLPKQSRGTVDTSTIPDLVGRSFGLKVEATERIVAERSTYFASSPSRLWGGGHGSAGATHPSTYWFFAEGATGEFRDTFLLLNNPHDVPAAVNLLFLTGNGRRLEFFKTVEPRSRLTIPVESLQQEFQGAPLLPLADAQFSMYVSSGTPIVAERAMYWVGDPGPWADGTSTLGQTASSKRWGFAEGRIGGPLGYHTYIRVANGHFEYPADVRITFLRTDGSPVVQTYTIPGHDFITVDVNSVPGLQNGESVAAIVETTNDGVIFTERSMYWNSGDAFWAGGIATAGTRLP
jgi:hypothetical protein